jgi:predicted nucleotidyltransferase
MEVQPEDFVVLNEACTVLDNAGVPFVIGGGTAVVVWGRDRCTKDFDLFLNREVLRSAMDALSIAGFVTTDTEKRWLYKAWRGEMLVDLIVESRGGVRVDDDTLTHARIVNMFGYDLRIMGAEDVLFRKILTLTEGRPDWYDALSIVERQRDTLDWTYLLYRAQRQPRRVLSFLLFAQTELNRPRDAGQAAMNNFLFHGDAPGPIPQWVVFTLIQQEWLAGSRSPRNPYKLEHTKKAA